MAAADYVTVVQQLYVAYYGRPADTTGLAGFTAALDAAGVPATAAGVEAAYGTSATIKALVDSFGNADEAVALYGTGTTESFVFAIYENVLNRVPDAAGFAFWVDALDNAGLSRGSAALSIMKGALENTTPEGLADAALITARIAVATNFTTAITTESATFSGDAAAATAREMLATVTASTDVTTFQSTIVSTLTAITNPDAGSTFTLTTSATADSIIGTAKNDTINAAAGTYANTDLILDSTTTDADVLNITSTGVVSTGTITNIETINVTAKGNVTFTAATTGEKAVNVTIASTTASHTVNATGISGATLTVDRVASIPSGALSIAGGTEVAVSNLKTNLVAGSVVTKLTAGLVDNDTVAVTVDGSTVADVTVTGIDEAGVTVKADEDATVTLDAVAVADTAASVTASGEVTLETGSATASVDLLTLSGNGAAVEYTITSTNGAVAEYTVTGSQAVTLIGDAAEFTATELANDSSAAVVLAATTGGALDLTDWDVISNIELAADFAGDTVTVNTGSTVTVAKDQTGALTVAAAVAADADTNSLTLVVGDDGVDDDEDVAASTQVAATALTLSDFATVSISVADDALVASGALDATGADVTLSGDADVTFVDVTADTLTITNTGDISLGEVTADSVTASTMTGDLDLTYASEGSVESGAGDDVIDMDGAAGTEVQSVATGAGDDEVTVTDVEVGSAVDTGAGEDEVTIVETKAVVISTGADDDVVTFGAVNTDAVLDAGTGSDSLVVTGTADVSGGDNFAFTGFEIVDVAAAQTFTISNAQFGGKSFALEGSGVLEITADGATTAQTINASTITLAFGTAATTSLIGGTKGDTITGTVTDDTIDGGAGADVMNGGTGTDTFVINAGDSGAVTTWTDTTGGSTISTTALDIITVVNAQNDIIDLSGLLGAGAFTAQNNVNTQVTDNAALGQSADITTFTGTYNATTGLFTSTAAASATDLLVVYDTDGDGVGTTYQAVVLVGVTAGAEAVAGDGAFTV